MARETRAQREARWAAERLADEARERVEYPARLMNLLERAAKFNYELTVENGRFVVFDRDRRSNFSPALYALTLGYEPDNALNELEVVFFQVCQAQRNRGIAKQALKDINNYFCNKILKPVDIVETAEGFWHKMEAAGLVSLE